MRRKQAKPTFNSYSQAQPSLIPPSWDELIPAEHIVQVVNGAIDKIELEPLLKQYKGGGTSSYSKTDEDATFFRMNEDRGAEKPLPKPAYDVRLGTEGQFVVGFSLHQRAGDTTCLIPHLEGLRANLSSIAQRELSDLGRGNHASRKSSVL